MPEKQQFNILAFSTRFIRFKDTLVRATLEIKRDAISWIRSLDPTGNTNYEGPLRFAFSQPGVDAVHLLSDGRPNLQCKNLFCMPIRFAPEVGFASVRDMEVAHGVWLIAVQVVQSADAILKAARVLGLSATEDTVRAAAAGRLGFVLQVTPASGAVRLRVPGVGEAWFPSQNLYSSELPILFDDLSPGDRVQVISDWAIVYDACLKSGMKVTLAKESQIASMLGQDVIVVDKRRGAASGITVLKVRFGSAIVEIGDMTVTAKKVQNRAVPIHTTLFSPDEKSSDKDDARHLLQSIAHFTKGSFREPYF